MAVSKRIQAICSMVPRCRCVADIGCDHGQIMLCLMQSGRADCGLACDISAASLAKARALFAQHEYPVSCIQCDGLEAADESDCAVIAGIGGVTISHILSGAREGQTYILQPSDSAAELRIFLAAGGYKILRESIVHDGRYYCIMAIEKERQPKPHELTYLEAELGRCNINHVDADVLGYARWRLAVHRKALRRPADSERGKAMQARLREICNQLEEFIYEAK